MILTPVVRKLALTAHVLSSVGWFGAVVGFLVLSLVGLTVTNADEAKAAYLSLEPITWLAIVPLCFASLTTGILQAWGTPWGLLQHYWVAIKLLLTAGSTFILLIHTEPIGEMARAAATMTWASPGLESLRLQLAVDAGAALVVLVLATLLAVVKPKGRTPLGFTRAV